MKTYLEQWFDEIERDVKPENWKQCNALSHAYLGKYTEGSFKGWSKSLTLEDVIKRKEKGAWIVEQEYKKPRTEVNDEVKATMDIMQSTFIEYLNSAELQIDIWRERQPQEATRSLYELSMVYMGREFNGEKSPSLESIESRYKRANQIILKQARKDLTLEKLKAIKNLTKRFEEYEKNVTYQEKYRQALRQKNQEAIHTLERFAEYNKIIKKPIRKEPQKPQEAKQNILFMPAGEAVKKVWNATKSILSTKLF